MNPGKLVDDGFLCIVLFWLPVADWLELSTGAMRARHSASHRQKKYMPLHPSARLSPLEQQSSPDCCVPFNKKKKRQCRGKISSKHHSVQRISVTSILTSKPQPRAARTPPCVSGPMKLQDTTSRHALGENSKETVTQVSSTWETTGNMVPPMLHCWASRFIVVVRTSC